MPRYRPAARAARDLVVVVYDVSSDDRRERIAKVLLAYGERVQKSVFECQVSERERGRIESRIAALLEAGDAVRYYELCGACARRIRGMPPPDRPEVPVLVV